METAPQNYLSRDADGFMDKITDLMEEEPNVVIGPPGSSHAVMVPIKHVGNRQKRDDNVAGTGLTWIGDETHLVPDDKAVKLLKFPDVWAFDESALDAHSGVTMEGMVPLTVYVTASDFEAVASGLADMMVVHKQPGAVKELNDELTDLDRDGLLALADRHEIKVDRRMGEDKLREFILSVLSGTTE